MKKLLILSGLMTAVTISLLSSTQLWKKSLIEDASPEYVWQQLAPPGSGTHQHEWKEGTYPSAIVPVNAFDEKLWMIGRKRAWSSNDGIRWDVFDKHDWGERISMNTVFFKGTLLISGGMDYSSGRFLNEIWASSDGTTWKKSVANAAWQPRKGQTIIEFNGRLWLFGGETGVDEHKAPNQFINDIWSSDDGLNWIKVADEAPWQVRGQPQVVVFQKQLWLIGGQGLSDVWKSLDGKTWSKIVDHCPWGNRYDYGLNVFDGRLWVFGGRQADPHKAYRDVWSSHDGLTWKLESAEAPWTARSGNFSVTFNDKLLLYGGKHTGHNDSFSGDIWALTRTNN